MFKKLFSFTLIWVGFGPKNGRFWTFSSRFWPTSVWNIPTFGHNESTLYLGTRSNINMKTGLSLEIFTVLDCPENQKKKKRTLINC